MPAATVACALLLSCDRDTDATELAKIEAAARRFEGLEVRAIGHVSDLEAPYVFELQSDELFGGDLVVISLHGEASALREGNDVVATGRMRHMSAEDVREEYGIELPDQVDIDASLVLVADRISFLDDQ